MGGQVAPARYFPNSTTRLTPTELISTRLESSLTPFVLEVSGQQRHSRYYFFRLLEIKWVAPNFPLFFSGGFTFSGASTVS